MAVEAVIYTLQKMTGLHHHLKHKMTFYAPLIYDMVFMGVEPATFTRSGITAARSRFAHNFYIGAGAINVPRFTFASGLPTGLLLENAAVNLSLHSSDMGDAVWANTNMTAAVNDTTTRALDGTFTADKLTATAPNATVFQDLGVIASASKVYSVEVRRVTGTGNVELSLDGGSSYGAPLTLSTTTWTEAFRVQTLANPDVGIRIATSGDEILVHSNQLEDNATIPSSKIPTTTVSATRGADVLTFSPLNRLHDGNTLVWVEDGVVKDTPAFANPFNSSGQWVGAIPAVIRQVVKFNEVLSAGDLTQVKNAVL
jgi:hypothetical protein